MNIQAKFRIEADTMSAVIALAKAAGDCVLEIYRDYMSRPGSNAGLTLKADASPLTQADLEAHHLLTMRLAVLTPGIPVVSEESADLEGDRKSVGCFWLIDPLDGTKEFLAGNGEFTVNIALIENGCPVWGVVCAPALGQLYWGGKKLGAFREVAGKVEKISVAKPVSLGGSYRVVASKSHLNFETEDFIGRLGRVSLIQAGSSLKLCRVAEGAADVYPRLAPTCEWDTAAAQAVVEGAGGFVIDTLGKPLVYGKPVVLNPSFIVSSVPLETLIAHD